MAEVQRNTQSGENAARFIEFVMMQAQNASLFLGLIPNPQTGQGEVNLQLAKLFIDQLAMIQEKTRGNLSGDETNVLRNALSNLQMAFYEVSQGKGAQPQGGASAADLDDEAEDDDDDLTAGEPSGASAEREMAPPPEPAAPSASASSSAPSTPSSGEDRGESKKRFTKSYGA